MTSAFEIAEDTAQMPEFWDRKVVFFANLFEIFYGNQDKTDALAAMVGPSQSYGARFLPALDLLYQGPENLLVLEETPPLVLCDYFRDELGLSLPELLVMPSHDYRALARWGNGGGDEAVDRILKTVADHIRRSTRPEEMWIDGFVTDATLEKIARRLGLPTTTTQSGSRKGNNKLLLYRHLEANGRPVISTEFAGAPGEIAGCLESLRRQGFTEAVVKSQTGASGIGLVKLEIGRDGGDKVPGYFFTEGPCMVQGWLRPGLDGITEIRSPSVQFFLADDRAVVYDVTEQLLTGRILHAGNQSPPPYLAANPRLRDELLEQTGVAIRWLHEQGYRGFGGVDFIVVERPDGRATEVYVSEINARVTAATYPSILVRRFDPGSPWLLRNVELRDGATEAGILQQLRDRGHLFQPGRPGIIPLNFLRSATGTVNKGQFLCLGETGRKQLSDALNGLAAERT